MPFHLKLLLIISLAVVLQACNGTSGTSNGNDANTSGNQTSTSLEAQTLSFHQTGPINVFVTHTFTNAATGEGSGAITYLSSDDSIATVNSVGIISAQRVGVVTISAIIAKDESYAESSTSYQLNSILEPVNLQQGPAITAAVGDEVNNALSGGGTGVITYLSSAPSVATVDDNGLVSILSPGSVTITSSIAADNLYPASSIQYSITSEVKPFAFAQTGSLFGYIGNEIANPATGGGLGEVSYYSSDDAIATVTDAGVVSVIKAGTVDITASIATDPFYPAEQISYELSAVNGAFELNAWVGKDDSNIHFSSVLSGFELYLSSQSDCDIVYYDSCPDGQLNNLDGISNDEISNTAFRLDQTGYATFKYGNNSKKIALVRRQPTINSLSRLVYFKQVFWLYTDDVENNIWSSPDGMNWQQVSSSAAFAKRILPQVVEFKNKLWLVGGGADLANNDVWSSEDGENWLQVTSDGGFPVRGYHQVVVFLDKLWIIGGIDDDGGRNDIWSSADGVSWTQETTNNAFSTRGGHQVVVFAGKLWFFAGIESDHLFTKDIWSSVDGINWVLETADADFSERGLHRVISFQDKLWLFGGHRVDQSLNDIWSSEDGINWTQEVAASEFSEYFLAQVVSSGAELWYVGGNTKTQDDVWKSSDGRNWRLRYKLPIDLSK